MRRRGADLGGDAEELGRHASEQEQALRTLISEQAAAVPGVDESTELRSRLQTVLTSSAAFSGPAEPAYLSSAAVTELVAAVRTVLDNVERHAGGGARAFLLLEDLGDEVVLTVRDDGPGIPEGRLDVGQAEGRMGVSKSIRGRMTDLGGEALLDTDPDIGTERELHLPRN